MDRTVKVNVDMIKAFGEENGLNPSDLSILITGHAGLFRNLKNQDAQVYRTTAHKIADAIGVSYEKLTDVTRFETANGKVMHKDSPNILTVGRPPAPEQIILKQESVEEAPAKPVIANVDSLRELAKWVSELYIDGIDKVDIVELMNKLREVRNG